MSAEQHTTQANSQKRFWLLAVINGIAILVICGLVTIVVRNPDNNAAGQANACKTSGATHSVRLQGDQFTIKTLAAKQCDRLVITNKDELSYSLHFGQHDNHLTYPGYRPSTLIQHERLEIILRKAGTYTFHDHFRDNAHISLTITSQQ